MPKTWTVDRKTWYRGKGPVDSFLRRRTDGMMCCLGHRALACGLTPESITNLAAPDDYSKSIDPAKDWQGLLKPESGLRTEVCQKNHDGQ